MDPQVRSSRAVALGPPSTSIGPSGTTWPAAPGVDCPLPAGERRHRRRDTGARSRDWRSPRGWFAEILDLVVEQLQHEASGKVQERRVDPHLRIAEVARDMDARGSCASAARYRGSAARSRAPRRGSATLMPTWWMPARRRLVPEVVHRAPAAAAGRAPAALPYPDRGLRCMAAQGPCRMCLRGSQPSWLASPCVTRTSGDLQRRGGSDRPTPRAGGRRPRWTSGISVQKSSTVPPSWAKRRRIE